MLKREKGKGQFYRCLEDSKSVDPEHVIVIIVQIIVICVKIINRSFSVYLKIGHFHDGVILLQLP